MSQDYERAAALLPGDETVEADLRKVAAHVAAEHVRGVEGCEVLSLVRASGGRNKSSGGAEGAASMIADVLHPHPNPNPDPRCAHESSAKTPTNTIRRVSLS